MQTLCVLLAVTYALCSFMAFCVAMYVFYKDRNRYPNGW